MGATLIGHFEPGTDAWHAARRDGLGGSEIAPVLGLSPWESRFSLWHRKAGLVAPVQESPEMEWGKRLEPVILQKYRDNHPELDFRTRNGTFAHDDRPWQIANPDLLAVDRVVEAKFAMFGDGWGEPGTDQIPIYYRTQVLWYLDCLGIEQGDVCVLIGGCDYREYSILHDETEAAELRTAALEFLESIAEDDRPDIDSHSATYEVIREMHPEITEADVELDDATAERYLASRAALEAATGDEQLARSLIAEAMGNAKKATWDGRTIAHRQARGNGTPYVVAARNLTKNAAAA
jgi:putative phage-type endonuclease